MAMTTDMLISIAGWGLVPRMAPPPSQGGSMYGEREREREREMMRESERLRENYSLFIHSP